jgi:hypothetical protein
MKFGIGIFHKNKANYVYYVAYRYAKTCDGAIISVYPYKLKVENNPQYGILPT